MDGQEIIKTERAVLKIEYLPSLNYSMLINGVETCSKCVVHNVGPHDWHQLQITVKGEFIKDDVHRIDFLRSGQSVQVSHLKIEPEIKKLREITEAIHTTFTIIVDEQEGRLVQQEFPIMLLSYDEWAGVNVMPEHIASFVVPNNPLLSRVKVAAARYLEKWTGSSQLDEYQTQDRNRVRVQVAAIYEALCSEGIVYSSSPPSFETIGQRIRLSDKVLTEKLGNCLDTSLLIASCLESCNIYPILIFMKGHAMVGAWLTPMVSPQMTGDDVSLLLKETADGNNNLVVIESTAITSSGKVGFEDAVVRAITKLKEEDEFYYYVDIHRCRLGGIRPFPQRMEGEGVGGAEECRDWGEGCGTTAEGSGTTYVNELTHYDLRLEKGGEATTKQTIWERKLLDFTLRNNLLNTRLGRRVVPFISFDIEHLEDHLQNNEDYAIIPCPGREMADAKRLHAENGMYDSQLQAGDYQRFVCEMMKDGKIVSYQTEAELQHSLTYIYRTARTSLEENGANSLFLALGMLRWYENGKSEQARYAPILLLPVDIIRRSAGKFVIRKRDEDIMLNITLVELLRQNFKINLEGLKELPRDESGVDVKKIFTYFRRAIIEQKRWNVLEECLLGLFSFNKFVMWNDIHSNADKLAENIIVASLIENRDKQEGGEGTVDAREIDKSSSPKDFSIPLDVDSSQMEAIVESGKGGSFILHGPPGTGKSQTITNMIANALYQGRRVLFVAEKMAALSVVQSRLEKIGLAPFCLELHSNKATKKHFLEQMDRVLNVTRIKEPAEYAAKAEELFAERKRLISYMDALHKKGSSGMSLYESICEYLSIDGDEMEGWGDGRRETPAYGEGRGDMPRKEMLTVDYIAKCKEEVALIDTILDIVGTPESHPLFGLEPTDNRMETTEGIRRLLLEYRQTLVTYAQALSAHRNEIMGTDVGSARREWKEIAGKWFLPRYFAKKKFLKALTELYGRGMAGAKRLLTENVEEVFALISDYQRRRDVYEVWQMRDASLQSSEEHGELLALFQKLNDLKRQLEEKTVGRVTAEDVEECIDRWLGGYGQMKDWYLWVEKKKELTGMNLQMVVSHIEKGEKPGKVMPAFLKSVYRYLIEMSIDGDEQLRKFNGQVFRQRIEQYKQNTLQFQELSKQELYSKLAARVPSSSAASAEGSEISILKRNINNGGRGNSIRGIIDSIPTLLPRLCPCMLMSPISVAQYIDLNAGKFDLVIFDEASQMPTSEAVGAIARGKALVVVGDSKQMPPTSFFTTTQVDDDEADIDDMESILDDCRTLSLREYYLSWHYRSKHESLIAFSNAHYYDNRLLTFPSVDDQMVKVRLVPVDGVYDKGHTRSNAEESKAIVKEIIRRLRDAELSKYSIGVVSFSKVQGDRIEDDLTEELDRHPELKEIAYNSPEPVFVKNLENVQGDERDVILFSVGYGADKNGKVSMNFGPLNNAGGERRLNVAVSRARYEMIVYSTLKSSQIDLKRSQAKGVEGLKSFLEYAETGHLPMVDSGLQEVGQNVMVKQICEMLAENGYVAQPFVGRSNFKVDIAVSTAEHPERYILGILCDGKTYYETKTTRDREIVQPNVMKMLGWNVMRVYSIDWYENRERCMGQILDKLKENESSGVMAGLLTEKGEVKGSEQDQNALDCSDERENVREQLQLFNAATIDESEVLKERTKNEGKKPYLEAEVRVPAIDKAAYNAAASYNAKVMEQILLKEQPMTENYLCKRMARLFGFGHAGANVQRAVALASSKFYRDRLSLRGVSSLWIDEASCKNFTGYRAPSPRSIMEIPVCEIMNAVREVIVEEFSLPKEKIPTIAARKLGFSNAGAKIVETINAVLSMMLDEKDIRELNGMVSFNEAEDT